MLYIKQSRFQYWDASLI